MFRVTLGAILGAVVLFVWMGVSWMALPWHCFTLGKFTHEDSVASVMVANTERNGIYVLPNCNDMKKDSAAIEAMKKGPIVFAAVQHNGYDVESPRPYIISFIIYLIGAFFVTFMVMQTKLVLTYGGRLWFVTAFGIAAGVLASFPEWNWWGFSFSYAIVSFFDFVIGWFLAGLMIAAVTGRRNQVTT